MTLTPAYGRDYTSKKQVIEAWNNGDDFIIADIMHPYSGKPANKNDLKDERNIMIRYSGLRKITKV